MWTYKISAGVMSNGDISFDGYSGKFGPSLNNPAYCPDPDIGPIPTGAYTIGEAAQVPILGACVMSLTPNSENDMFGRSAFFIHGDAINNPGHASEGCIILPRNAREAIAASGDDNLTVIP